MEWQPVKGYENWYQVSRDGQIRRTDGSPVTQFLSDQGYSLARVSKPRAVLRVHRIVAEAFIENPLCLPIINHIDCNRSNNSFENLEWCTQKQNLDHSRNLGRMCQNFWLGKRSPNSSLTDEAVEEIRKRYSEGGISYESLAKSFGTNKRTVGRIIKGETYAMAKN